MSINRKASKKHSEIVEVSNLGNERFEDYIEHYGDRRLVQRLLKGRIVKPCDRECWEYGKMIAETYNHASFKNFTELMDDKEFLIEIAKLTPKPTECANYFWLYVNPYLKKDKQFRLDLLRAIYLNESVYELDVINTVIEFCGFEQENSQLVSSDINLRNSLEGRLANNYNEQVRKGLVEILNTFKIKEELDLRQLIEMEFFY